MCSAYFLHLSCQTLPVVDIEQCIAVKVYLCGVLTLTMNVSWLTGLLS